jgi:ABC-type bacteriocin/lantibiotic exporter with double-glycine peptidase domain
VIAIARPHPQARYLAPEVVQTSTMDCGPASLQALVQGFGLSVSYGRLREACQTAVDGTSISTMDEIANLLGLDAEEKVVPPDHLLIPESCSLPAIVVVRNPDGSNHFVVAWSVAGPWVQVMDPAEGRHWTRRAAFFDRLYSHMIDVPASAWREWVAEAEFMDTLDVRLAQLEISAGDRERLRKNALADETWRSMGVLDAATRMTTGLVESGAVPRGAVCLSLIEQQVTPTADGGYPMIAGEYYSAWRKKVQPPDAEEEILTMRGAVLMRARGRREEVVAARAAAAKEAEKGSRGADARTGGAAAADASGEAPYRTPGEGAERESAPARELPPELMSRLSDEPTRPGRTLLKMLAEDGVLAPVVLAMVLVVSAALVTVDAILLRGLLDVSAQLGLPSQRAAAIAAVLAFLALGLFIELPLMAGALRLGRMLDVKLRLAFLSKLPRLDDRYFRSRLLSDMAERGHSLHLVRILPMLGVRLLASSAQLVVTVIGIAWIDPKSALLALIAAALSIALPLATQPLLTERELRVRTHAGALGRFYLDALLGLLPIRVHGARSAMQRQQDALLVQWVSSGLRFHAASTAVIGMVSLIGTGMAVLMVHSVASHSQAGLLLLVYWALSLPALGQSIALISRQYPVLRNVVARLLEPLDTPEAEEATGDKASAQAAGDQASREAVDDKAVTIHMQGVSVKAAGNLVLDEVELSIKGGEHIAIVGASGAGKSSLVGLLLGWYRPAQGQVLVDGRPLVGEWLSKLRCETAWVDPAVALWNRSFLDNLRYGASGEGELPLAQILAKAKLRQVLEHLPDGLATELGEGGGMVSGGEGQRTRVGRALARRRARLVILDEPFRGLDIETRRQLMAMAREWWKDATLMLVTHDIAETESFDRVLVIDGGKIAEDGNPKELLENPRSRYATWVRSDRELRAAEWSGDNWRRVWLSAGRVREEEGATQKAGKS